MKRISAESIQEVNARADAHSVIGEYVRLEKKGGRYWGLCPFHNEKTPSFSVDQTHNLFYCFGCGKGGSVISFLMEHEKFTYVEAVQHLAQKLGIELVWEGNYDVEAEAAKQDLRTTLRELYTRVAGSFRYWLNERPEAADCREYLASRGVDPAMAEIFALGYAPANRRWLHQFLAKKGYSDDFLSQTGLFSRNYPTSSFFSDRLMFPICDRDGSVIGFGGRLLSGEGPKYLNSPDSPIFHKSDNLYALHLALPEIRKTGTALICEGYMDVIALHQAGVHNAVAPLGTAFTESQARLLKRWCSELLLVFDSDGAGKNATIKAIQLCRDTGLSCRVVRIEGGKDPAEILQSGGPEALHKALNCCIKDFEYLIEYARGTYAISTAEGKMAATRFMFPFLASVDGEVARSSLMDTVSDSFGADRTAMVRDFNTGAWKQHSRKDLTSSDSNGRSSVANMAAKPIPSVSDELFFIMCLVVNRPLYRKVRAVYAPDDLVNSYARELFVALEESFRADREDLDFLLEKIESEELRSFVLAQHSMDVYARNPERTVEESIAFIKRKKLEARSEELVRRLRMLSGSGGEDEDIGDLMLEKKHVDEELALLKERSTSTEQLH